MLRRIIFIVECGIVRFSLRYACIHNSGIMVPLDYTFVPNFVSSATSIAELAHGEKSRTQSPSIFDAPGTEARRAGLRTRLTRLQPSGGLTVAHVAHLRQGP